MKNIKLVIISALVTFMLLVPKNGNCQGAVVYDPTLEFILSEMKLNEEAKEKLLKMAVHIRNAKSYRELVRVYANAYCNLKRLRLLYKITGGFEVCGISFKYNLVMIKMFNVKDNLDMMVSDQKIEPIERQKFLKETIRDLELAVAGVDGLTRLLMKNYGEQKREKDDWEYIENANLAI